MKAVYLFGNLKWWSY